MAKRNAFTVHNYHGRRYYSAIDATILFNGHVVEEVASISWTLQQNTMPLFGYNSYVWDEIAKGTRIVSGTLTINFTVPDYLDLLINGQTEDSIKFTNNGKEFANKDYEPIWRKGVSIGIGYGSRDAVVGEAPCIFLTNCQFQSRGQGLDTTGQALMETYSFIARDMVIQR